MPWPWWVLVLDTERSPSLRSFCECYQFWTDENLRVTVRIGNWKYEKFKPVLAHVPMSWEGKKLLVYTSKGWGQTVAKLRKHSFAINIDFLPISACNPVPSLQASSRQTSHSRGGCLLLSLQATGLALSCPGTQKTDWGGLELYGMLSQHTSCLWFKKCCKTSWGAYD